ncbi:hypothetical protein GSY74_04510 [Sulfurovum sp. bin170]|uniref:hypothetical protein n=1 Tax=Sulfurovum sp. bin170 TaxID=2695268 RepID=UPI0013E001D5|nr:hypothetical protein [Sulfurovum sp. bin170]NEW60538.1 hypothetical protein [Sulfurovum sp. bin170]
MKKIVKKTIIITTTALFTACVPTQGPQPTKERPTMGTPIRTVQYGYPPRDYRSKIKNYFANRIKRADFANYTFSTPQRAYKRKGLAYGGDIAWRGWMVDVAIETESRTGRMQKSKPYMILFKNSVIVEDILGSEHKLLTKVKN